MNHDEAFARALKDARNESVSESDAQDLADLFGPIGSDCSETYLVAFIRTRSLDQNLNAKEHYIPDGEDEGYACVGDFDLEPSLTTARCPACGTIAEWTKEKAWVVVGVGSHYIG